MSSTTDALPELVVLYGTQTGNAQDVAETLAKRARRRRFQVTLSAIDEFELASLPDQRLVVFVASTTGDGEVPDTMRNFWRFLLRKALPKDALSALRFAVFGLGDSAYTKFNAVARKLHARLAQLGASPLVARGLGDEQSPQGIDGDLDDWLPGLWDALLTVYPLPAGYTVSDKPELDPPKYAVTTQPGPPPQTPASDRWLSSFYRAPRGVRGDATRGPLHARVLHNRRVTAPDWSQDVRHVVLALPAGGPSYRAGDVAHVYPENGVDVQAWCAELGLDADAVVRGIPWLRYPATVAQLLRRHLDVLGIPRRSFFEQLAFFATDDDERDKLFELATAEAAPLRQEYASREKRTYLEVMGEFPSARPPLEHVLSLIPPLQPRQFSIASADAARPGYVELCAAVVDYKTPFGRRKRGVCTDWFTTLDAGRGDTVPLWVAEGALRAPEDPSTPLLLIGPGTGIAPFRAIVHERAAMVAPDCAVGQGPPTPSPDGSTWRPQRALDDAQRAQLGKTIVFFGCRSASKDYYYRGEWEAAQEAGAVARVATAFSRDQARKCYVQHRIREARAEVVAMIEAGAHIMVAGSANQMPQGVQEEIEEAIEAERGMTREQARAVVRKLQRTGRYLCEAWS